MPNRTAVDGARSTEMPIRRDEPEALGRYPVSRAGLLAALPPEWPEDLCPRVRHLAQASDRKVVVLDDDPTGTQTVHSAWVLTRWSVRVLRRALVDARPLVYILTNSRSLPRVDAVALNREMPYAW